MEDDDDLNDFQLPRSEGMSWEQRRFRLGTLERVRDAWECSSSSSSWRDVVSSDCCYGAKDAMLKDEILTLGFAVVVVVVVVVAREDSRGDATTTPPFDRRTWTIPNSYLWL